MALREWEGKVVSAYPNPVSLRVFNREWTQINANKMFKIKKLW